jgi:hypothetical protein
MSTYYHPQRLIINLYGFIIIPSKKNWNLSEADELIHLWQMIFIYWKLFEKEIFRLTVGIFVLYWPLILLFSVANQEE